MYPVDVGVITQGSVLGPTLNQKFTTDLPCIETTVTTTFGDDTTMLLSHDNATQASTNLQNIQRICQISK